MGLFSFVGKALGKVVRAGASVLTHGASEKVISALKSRPAKPSPAQAEALLQKIGPPSMRMSRTESSSVEGWGYGKRSSPKRPAGKRRPRARTDWTTGRQRNPETGGYSLTDAELDEKTRLGGLYNDAIRRGDQAAADRYERQMDAVGFAPVVRRRARRPAKARTGAKRAPPKGGLDLKALSASWKAAGKPGTWQGWIQANK